MSIICRLILLHFLCCWIEVRTSNCPNVPNCICPEIKNSKHLKLKCSRLQSIEDLLTNEKYMGLPPINNLDLSNNSIRVLPANAFPVKITGKLILDRNNIETIHDYAFRSLGSLKKLVLSNNKLRELRRGMFEGLDAVDQLKLSHNLLVTISEDAFKSLPALKQLDISSNPLSCTCDISWLVTSHRLKLNPMPKCETPRALRGQQIDAAHLQSECHQVYSFTISPVDDQIVFEGDSLKMMCVVHGFGKEPTTDQLMSWKFKDHNPTLAFENTIQSQDVNVDEDTLESTLVINELNENHSGKWSCHAELSSSFNRSLSITVNVLSKETIYCEASVTEDDKGRYTWPASTVAGHLVDLPCEVSESTPVGIATHLCSSNGSWLNLNTDNCPYTSIVTRILQNFSKMNMTNHKDSLIQSAIGLQNYTLNNVRNITHVKDVHFIVQTMENYIKYLEDEPDFGTYLLELVSSVLKLPKSLLEKAQQQHFACSRMISTIETIYKFCQSLDFSSNEFAVTEISLSADTLLSGVTCSWIRFMENLISNCSTQNKTLFMGSNLEATIHIAINGPYPIEVTNRLVVTVFNDSRLFPDRSGNKESSLVIGVYMVNSEMLKVEQPILISIKKSVTLLVPTLAWWNEETGLWSRNACRLTSSIFVPQLKFSCDRLGYFSLLSEHSDVTNRQRTVQQRLFDFLQPSIYIGTFISVTCLLLASATYCFCYEHIQMSKKMKHSLMNTWLSASFLFLIFSIGIHQTDHVILCQGIGLSLHYFMLATLFWMAVTIKALHKRVQRSSRSVSTPSEDLPAGAPIDNPILGVYLVGWGIPAIICGIAGAVNMHGYSGSHYCFLTPGPELCTVFIPACVVMFYLLIMSLLIGCTSTKVASNLQLSVGTQAIDLELLGSLGGNGRSYCNSARSLTTPSSQAEDPEHSPLRQLKAFIIFWTFYLMAIASAAACVMKPFQSSPNAEKIFSVQYAVVCLLMGAFSLFSHCFARNDVRSAWSRLLRGKGAPQKTPQIVANSFLPSAPTTHTLALTRVNEAGGAPASAGFVADAQAGPPNTFQPTTAVDNRSIRSDFLKQTPNINLVSLHRQHYRGCSTLMADGNFYNPHQSIVAKKFFKKQRKKRNNTLQVRKCRSGGSSPVSPGFLFNGDVARMKVNAAAALKRHDEGDGCDNEENVQFLRHDRYDELSSEKHPLTYDEADITGCEEGKTGTESEATFTVPEYAEIQEQNSAAMNVPPRIPTKEQMCGTSDHEWCSCDAISDVNSEPTYNYAYIRNGYASSRSVMSDHSSGNSHLYTSVAADVSNSMDRSRSRHRPPRAHPPRSRPLKSSRPSRTNYAGPSSRGVHRRDDYDGEFNGKNSVENGDFRKRRKEEGYAILTKDTYHGLSPSSDFSSEDKVETCV